MEASDEDELVLGVAVFTGCSYVTYYNKLPFRLYFDYFFTVSHLPERLENSGLFVTT
jgi:hypothetical protein